MWDLSPSFITWGIRPKKISWECLMVLCGTALISTVLAVVLTTVNMVRHKRENRHPLLQKYTLRILFMVPLYSVTSCASLIVGGHQFGRAMEVIRMLYETVVIFCFLQYILACSGGVKAFASRFERRGLSQRPLELPPGALDPSPDGQEPAEACPSERSTSRRSVQVVHQEQEDSYSSEDSGSSEESVGSQLSERSGDDAEALRASTFDMAMGGTSSSDLGADEEAPSGQQLKQLKHMPLLDRCLPPWRSGRQMLAWCIRGTLSYIACGLVYAIFKVGHFFYVQCLSPEDQLDRVEGRHSSTSSLVAQVLLGASQGLAITSLATLGVNMLEELRPLKGHWKFLSVKLVVFFTFWQGCILWLLVHFDVLHGLVDAAVRWDRPIDVSCAFQHWLICLEMLVASVLHFKVWPPHDYLTMLALLELHRDKLDSPRTSMSESPRQVRARPVIAGSAVDLRDIYQTAESVMQLPKKSRARSR